MFGIIEKEQKLKVEGTLLGKIGTLMDEMGTKTLCKEHYWMYCVMRTIYSFICNFLLSRVRSSKVGTPMLIFPSKHMV